MHKTKLATVLFGAAVCCTMSFQSFAELVLIVHPSNDSTLDTRTVGRIFLGKEKKFSNGGEVLPINQSTSSPSRASFDNDALGRSTTQVTSYWSKLVFTGKGTPPKTVDNDAAVIAIVSSDKNAIGYIDSASVSSAVKAISLNELGK